MVRGTLVVLMLAALAGCGGGGSSVPASTAATTTAAASTAVATTAPATTEGRLTSPTTPTTAVRATGPATVAELLTRKIVLAHAGGDDDYPHSTPFAFSESVKAGVDVLDLDVRLSADGVLVVQHDDTVDRTTNGTGPVASMSYAELRALDNGYWFNRVCNTCKDRPDGDYPWRGVRTGAAAPPEGYGPDDFAIPTFQAIATRFAALPLNIEIKGTIDDGVGVPVATALAGELHALGRESSVVITSFDDKVLDAFHQLAPTVEISPGLQATAAWVTAGTPLPGGMRILQIPPDYQGIDLLTPDILSRAAAAGYPLWVWPNGGHDETADGYRALFALGVAGVNASKPAAAVAARPAP